MDGGNMGNYFKGVMLCNRPAAAPAIKTAFEPAYDNSSAPFVSTVTQAEQLGMNPIPLQLPTRDKKDMADDVTWRHKRWLAEFQERRNELSEMMEDTQVQSEEKTKRFQDQQSQMRATIREARKANPGDRDAMAAAIDALEGEEKLDKTIKSKKKPSAKPKWAMTKEQNEDDEELEVADLLEFTQNLDFDRYIGDLEVKEALTYVQDRVKELAKPKEMPEGYEGEMGEEGEEGEEGYITLADKKAARQVLKRRQKEDGEWEDYMSMAESVAESVGSQGSNMSKALLANNRMMKGVHSEKSVKAMLEQQKVLAVQEPVISENNPINGKDMNPSNLPYLFRSPGI